MNRDDWDLEAVIDWLFRTGRLCDNPLDFTKALGEKLIECGAPLWRLRLGCRTIHPQIAVWSVVWSDGMARAEERSGKHGFMNNDTYVGSPMAYVAESGRAFRRKLSELIEDQDHRVLFELAGEGATDYLAAPLVFSDGSFSNATVVTTVPEGFSDEDIAKFQRLFWFVGSVFEVFATRRIAAALLDTYVGHRTGERVLAGQIKRGDGETIDAAIWFSDLRDFTPLTETLAPEDLIDLLNTYFEAVTAAVTARGGEVLRFIGDAMLIVFPVTDAFSRESACRAAVDAATDAFDGLAAINIRRARVKRPAISFGVGIHVGKVIYGNVGAPDRLDFTVMGPAVNRTARLEGLTKELGHAMLMSEDVATAIGRNTLPLGSYSLKGVNEKFAVFALAEDD